jgi:hypothetical protein
VLPMMKMMEVSASDMTYCSEIDDAYTASCMHPSYLLLLWDKVVLGCCYLMRRQAAAIITLRSCYSIGDSYYSEEST